MQDTKGSAIAEDAPGLSTAHIWPLQDQPRLETAVNGSLSTVVCSPGAKSKGGPGGVRGPITRFSRSSRLRLLQFLALLNKNLLILPLFITFTYPDAFPEDPREWKQHLYRWRRRFERKSGGVPVIWRLEMMRRKSGSNAGRLAPHFHALVFVRVDDLGDFRAWLSASWYESCGMLDDKHLLAGTNATQTQSWRQVTGYLSKYVAKLETFDSASAGIGRHWGIWHKEQLRIDLEVTPLTERQAFAVRRVFRRFSGVRPRNRRSVNDMTIFLSYSTSLRLLRWLRYDPDELEDPSGGGGAPRPCREGGPPPLVGPRVGSGMPSSSVAAGGR